MGGIMSDLKDPKRYAIVEFTGPTGCGKGLILSHVQRILLDHGFIVDNISTETSPHLLKVFATDSTLIKSIKKSMKGNKH
jgi:hypothetical protein